MIAKVAEKISGIYKARNLIFEYDTGGTQGTIMHTSLPALSHTSTSI